MAAPLSANAALVRSAKPNEPADAGPRFHLSFRGGEGVLALAAPFSQSGAVITQLELSLGRMRFPMAISGGARRFRNRHTTLVNGAFRVPCRVLEKAAFSAGISLSIAADRADERSVQISLRDEFGVVAFRLRTHFSDAELRVSLHDIRTVHTAAAHEWTRVLRALIQLGFSIDETRGVLIWPDAIRHALMETLVMSGWRVPDTRNANFRVSFSPASSDVNIAVGVALDPTVEDIRETESLARMAPVLVALAAGRLDAARAHFDAYFEGDLHDEHAALLASLALHTGDLLAEAVAQVATEADSLAGYYVGLHVASRDRQSTAAVRIAKVIAEREPCADLAADALMLAADLSRAVEPLVAMELLARASARCPTRGDIALLALDLAAGLEDAARVDEVARRALASIVDSSVRGNLARAAASALIAVGSFDRAEELLTDARHMEPNHAATNYALADVLAARGERARAVTLFDRTFALATELGDTQLAVSAAMSAASTLLDLNEDEGATTRLVEAARIAGDDPSVWTALALSHARRGASLEAQRAFAHLLTLNASDDAVAGLAEAVRFHVDRGDIASARAFLDALSHAAISREAIDLARAEIVRATAKSWLQRLDVLRDLDSEMLDEIAREAGASVSSARALLGLIAFVDGDSPARLALRIGAVRIAAHAAGSTELEAEIAERAARVVNHIDDLALLLALEHSAVSDAVREIFAERAAAIHRAAKRFGDAATAHARAALLASDSARLRAALDLAEGHEAWADAQAIVESALRVVRSGPARHSLMERLQMIDARKQK